MLNGLYSFASYHPADRFTITSGDRKSQPKNYVGAVAPEGQSNHELYAYGKAAYDEAVDVYADSQPIGKQFGQELNLYGLHTPVNGDYEHLTLLSVNG